MDDFKEPDYFDDDEVRLEDLDVPDKGSRAFVYMLGEKLHMATYFRPRLVAPFMCTIILILILFLPGSALPRSTVQPARTTVTTSHENASCHDVTVNSKDINWRIPPSIPTPPDSVTLHLCTSGSVEIMKLSPNTGP